MDQSSACFKMLVILLSFIAIRCGFHKKRSLSPRKVVYIVTDFVFTSSSRPELRKKQEQKQTKSKDKPLNEPV